MEEKFKYSWAVLAVLAAFAFFCAGAFFTQSSWREPYKVTTEYRTPYTTEGETSGSEEDGWPESLLPGEVINVNTADVYDLQRLPGIGEKRAGDIIAYREEHGPFQTLDDLQQVSGIGPATVESLRTYAAVSG